VGGTADGTTGFTDLGAREYDPVTGRFLSADPVQDPTNPQQLNGYAYANNNPETSSDPSGLLSITGGDCVGSLQYCEAHSSGGGGARSTGSAGSQPVDYAHFTDPSGPANPPLRPLARPHAPQLYVHHCDFGGKAGFEMGCWPTQSRQAGRTPDFYVISIGLPLFFTISFTEDRYGDGFWSVGRGPSSLPASIQFGYMLGRKRYTRQELARVLGGPSAEACGAYWVGGCLVDENPGLDAPFVTHGHPLAVEMGIFDGPGASFQYSDTFHPTVHGFLGLLYNDFWAPVRRAFDPMSYCPPACPGG
jgi:RHS repeat-associated protein